MSKEHQDVLNIFKELDQFIGNLSLPVREGARLASMFQHAATCVDVFIAKVVKQEKLDEKDDNVRTIH